MQKIERSTYYGKDHGRKNRERTGTNPAAGAILESLIPEADAFTNEQIKVFLEKTIRTESARKAWANLNAVQAEPAAAAKVAEVAQGGGASTLKAGASATGEAG
jgi:hypothetical protein